MAWEHRRMVFGGILFVGAAGAALLVVPGVRFAVRVATERRPNALLVTVVSLAAALLIAWRATGVLHTAALSLVAACGIAAGWIDAYERRLPDVLILPLYPAVGCLLIATADSGLMLRASLCAAAGIALCAIGCATGQLGYGDLKLAGLLGLVLGWSSWGTAAAAVVGTVLVGGGHAAVVLALGRDDFPYGPAMLTGAAAALAVGPWI